MINVTINKKIDTMKLRELIVGKEKSTEEHRYDGNKHMVKVTYEEPGPGEWGGSSPFVTLEYDEKNSILLKMTIQYNRREARKEMVLTADELKQKVMCGLEKGIFQTEGDDNSTMLAIEKRKALVLRNENDCAEIRDANRTVRFEESNKSSDKG